MKTVSFHVPFIAQICEVNEKYELKGLFYTDN